MNETSRKKTVTLPEKIESENSVMLPPTPMSMLDRAVASGASIEVLERLMGLQERYQANQARMAFAAAMSAARREIPTIAKKRVVDFTSAKGRTNYQYEEFSDITDAVVDILGKHGLFFRFNTDQQLDRVLVTCIIEHSLGHQERNTLWAAPDLSGNKNPLQAIGSAVTYLQRYTLKAALGLAASKDDDGNASGKGDVITDEQAEQIRKLIAETKADVTKFLQWAGAESISDIRSSKFAEATALLQTKKTQAKS